MADNGPPHGERIVVVDDNAMNRKVVRALLAPEGYDVIPAESGAEAIALFEARVPDLVLLDILMPGLNGFETCRRLRALPGGAEVPIVFLTALGDFETHDQAVGAGGDDFLSKPINRTELILRVRSLLRVKRLNDAIRESHAATRKAHEELKHAEGQLVHSETLAALGRMVAGVAHEINNPLAYAANDLAVLRRDVRLVGELLRLHQEVAAADGAQGADLRERLRERTEEIDPEYTLRNLDALIDRARGGLGRIRLIVDDLRTFARLDEGDLHEVDLNAGVVSTLNVMRGEADRKQVELGSELGELPPVACYPGRINQVVWNLVANAIDACSPGGRVTVRTEATAEATEIHVVDTGRGIDDAIRDRIFEPFFTTRALGEGVGLGLSISHGIVQAHGGSIAVESTPGQGTHFVVRLPVRLPVHETAPDPPT